MDKLAALRLQIEYGADEALENAPVNRITRPPPSGSASLPIVQPIRAMASTQTATPLADARLLASKAGSIAELRQALLDFRGCGLSATATNLVFADGNAEAQLMLIGDCPGAEEDRAGVPFVGPSGALLDRMMASLGLDRTNLVMTNVVPWRPPGNRAPTELEVQLCLPFLFRHITLLRPRHLVLLGALATQVVLGSKGAVSRVRGRWAKASIAGLEDPVETLPIRHPDHLLRNPEAKRETWIDLIALRRALDSSVQ